MAITDNERLQETILLAEDRLSLVDKKWWYALVAAIVAAAPLYYAAKAGFVALAIKNYTKPELIFSNEQRQPLQVIAKGILDLGGGSYAGYAKVRNIEYDWGVPAQFYTAEFKTFGGTSITKVRASTFILPATEKLILFSRFSSGTKPDEIVFTLDPSHFIRKPEIDFAKSLERVNVQNSSRGLVVSAGVKNLTPFTAKHIFLPVAVYNNQNQIVAVGITSVDDVVSGETRTFQYSWSTPVEGAIRAEITPEVNTFDRNAFEVAPGVSPFDTR